VITVDLDRNLYTRHGFHINSKGKEHTEYRVVLVIKIALTWKDKEHRDSYPSENKQMLGIQEVQANGHENRV
jgi:hypothetical protein